MQLYTVIRSSAFIAAVAFGTLLFAATISLTGAAPVSSKSDASAVYVKYCALCHGDSGEGAKAPALQNLKIGDKAAVAITTKGDGKAMPGFASELTSKQIADLVAYLHKLGKKP